MASDVIYEGNPFTKAAELIEDEGWIQQSMEEAIFDSFLNAYTDVQGRCIEGALSRAMSNGNYCGYVVENTYDLGYDDSIKFNHMAEKVISILGGVIEEQYPSWQQEEENTFSIGSDDYVVFWNDNVCDSGSECVKMLEKASVKWDEEVG